MLSQKSRYALRALLHLARVEGEEPVQIAAIAGEERIPRKFLEVILSELKAHGLVISARGKHGGYRLGRAPSDISFGELIRIVDGPLALVPCASKTAYKRCEDCADEASCAIRKVMASVRDRTAEILEQTSLAAALTLSGEET